MARTLRVDRPGQSWHGGPSSVLLAFFLALRMAYFGLARKDPKPP